MDRLQMAIANQRAHDSRALLAIAERMQVRNDPFHMADDVIATASKLARIARIDKGAATRAGKVRA